MGLLTRRGNDRSCSLALVTTIPFVLVVCHLWLEVAWTWNALLGTAFSAAVAATGTQPIHSPSSRT